MAFLWRLIRKVPARASHSQQALTLTRYRSSRACRGLRGPKGPLNLCLSGYPQGVSTLEVILGNVIRLRTRYYLRLSNNYRDQHEKS